MNNAISVTVSHRLYTLELPLKIERSRNQSEVYKCKNTIQKMNKYTHMYIDFVQTNSSFMGNLILIKICAIYVETVNDLFKLSMRV